MATLHHVKKSRKAYRADGIKKGQPYWWWKFRNSGIYRSPTEPKRSQLTQSEFYGTIWDIEDRISELKADSSLEEAVKEIIDELTQLGEEQEEKRNNMPDSLQDSETGNLLEERKDACENAASELEQIDLEFDLDSAAEDDGQIRDLKEGDEDDKDEQIEARRKEIEDEFWQEKLDEVQNVTIES